MKKLPLLIIIGLLIAHSTADAQWERLTTFSGTNVQFLSDSVGFGFLLRVYGNPSGGNDFYLTRDGGKTWVNQTRGRFNLKIDSGAQGVNPKTICFSDPQFGLMAADSQYFSYVDHTRDYGDSWLGRTTDSGRSWNQYVPHPPLIGHDLRLLPKLDSDIVLLCSAIHPQHKYQPDQGLRIYGSALHANGPFPLLLDDTDIVGQAITDIAAFKYDHWGNALALLLDTGSRRVLVRKTRSDSSWRVLSSLDTSLLHLTDATDLAFFHDSIWFATSTRGIFRSDNSGSSWSLVTSTPTLTTHIVMNAAGLGYVSLQTNRYVLKTLDSGRTWRREIIPMQDHIVPEELQLAGRHLATLRGPIMPNRDGGQSAFLCVNRDGSLPRGGSLYTDSLTMNLGIIPRNDPTIFKLVVRNDDTTQWRVVGVTSTNAKLILLDSSATVAPNDSVPLHFQFRTLALNDTATILVLTNDSAFATIGVKVSLQTLQPVRGLTQPANVVMQLGEVVRDTFGISNSGTDTLHVQSMSADWIGVTFLITAPMAIAPGRGLVIPLVIQPTIAGTQTVHLFFQTDYVQRLDTLSFIVKTVGGRVWVDWVKRWSRSSDSDKEYAQSVAVTKENEPVVLSVGRWTGLDQDILIQKFDTSGNSIWINHLDGPAHKNDQPFQLLADSSGSFLVTGQAAMLTGASNAVLALFDSAGNPVWSNISSPDRGVPYKAIRVGPNDIVSVCNGFTSTYKSSPWIEEEDGLMRVEETSLTHDSIQVIHINGPSSTYWESGHSTVHVNANDYAVEVASDNDSGFYLLTSMDFTNEGYTPPGIDIRNYVLFHYTIGRPNADWSKVVTHSTMIVDRSGAAILPGAQTFRFTKSGDSSFLGNLAEGSPYIAGTANDLYAATANVGIGRSLISEGRQWTKDFSDERIGSVLINQNFDPAPIKLVIDRADNVYELVNMPNGKGSEINLLKYDSLGTLLWIAHYNGPNKESVEARDALMDHDGAIYVCGSSTDSNNVTRSLLLKFGQDPTTAAVHEEVTIESTTLLLYPNPSSNSITVVPSALLHGQLKCDVVDALGRNALSVSTHSAAEFHLKMASLPTGVYVVIVRDSFGHFEQQRFVHQR